MEEPLEAPSASPLLPRPQPATLAALLSPAVGPSTLVRHSTARQLDERRAHWAYSRPVVVFDIALNLTFATAAAAFLCATIHERPKTPVRVWLSGYVLQCVVHVALVWQEYRRRRRDSRERGVEEDGSGGERAVEDSSDVDSEQDDRGTRAWSGRHGSIAKRCESINTLGSFVWWIIGFCWVISGGEALLENAPTLYWFFMGLGRLTVVFLTFDALFAIFCLAFTCIIGIALFCCLPCVIAILCAVIGQEGASDADISILPRYRYSEYSDDGSKNFKEGLMAPILNNTGRSTGERVLLHDDARCCICLSSYEDGAVLLSLPCNHHFHSLCIVKWLRINATCPLCKFHILNG